MEENYVDMLRRSGDKPEDFWVAFDNWLTERVSGDSYIVYKPRTAQHQAPLSALKKWGISVEDRNYRDSILLAPLAYRQPTAPAGLHTPAPFHQPLLLIGSL